MFDHFWLDLVGLVLSNLVCSVLIRFSQTRKKEKKKNGLEYRVAAQLKIWKYSGSASLLLLDLFDSPVS